MTLSELIAKAQAMRKDLLDMRYYLTDEGWLNQARLMGCALDTLDGTIRSLQDDCARFGLTTA